MKHFVTPLILFLLLLISCHEETECDTAGYAAPEISLSNPKGPDIQVPGDSLFSLQFSFKSEAGLNTFSMNGEPIHVFTHGETEAEFIFKRYFWESGEVLFVLHDLCDQSADLIVNMTVNHPIY